MQSNAKYMFFDDLDNAPNELLDGSDKILISARIQALLKKIMDDYYSIYNFANVVECAF